MARPTAEEIQEEVRGDAISLLTMHKEDGQPFSYRLVLDEIIATIKGAKLIALTGIPSDMVDKEVPEEATPPFHFGGVEE